jgi:Glycosyl hydrolases family 28
MSDFSRRRWLALLPAASAVPLWGQPLPQGSGDRTHNILEYGAKGDGQTLDTAAVQKAIDACHGDRGGVVLVPAGDFLVGTLELKSNVTLHISASGRLLGSGKPGDYSAGKGVPPGNGNVVLLYAVDAENVTIEGPGTIDGQGQLFYTGKGDNTGPGGNAAEGYRERPHLAIFYRCRNLLLRDVFLTRSAYHCVRLLECRYVRLDGVRIHNRVNLNNDGFHINGNQYVNIVNCNVMCQDDACALFGSNKFITVTNCTFSTRWSIFRFGNGECENIAISNCVIYDTYGCVIKMRFSAGTRIENVSFSNLVMRNVTGPISIGLDSNYRRPANAQTPPRPNGVVRNLTFQGIRATVVAEGAQYADMPFRNNFRPGETRSCITLNGVGDEYLEGITMNDIHVTYGGGGTAEEAARRDIPKMAGEYFELGTLPAYGLYARNVRGLTLHDVRFEVSAPDLRPAMVFDHVEDATVNGFAAQGNAHSELLRFIDSRDVLVSAARVLTPAAAFLQLEGEGNRGITVDGGDLSKAAETVVLKSGAKKDAVKVRG